jgi:hypothetical protein
VMSATWGILTGRSNILGCGCPWFVGTDQLMPMLFRLLRRE